MTGAAHARPVTSVSEQQRLLVVPAVDGLQPAVEDRGLQTKIESSVRRDPEIRVDSWEDVRARLVAPPSANGSHGQDPIGAALATCRRLYVQQQFEALIGTVQTLEREHLGDLARPVRARQAAALNRLAGIAHHALDSQAAASDRFGLALALAPDAELDSALYPPRVVALFRATKTTRASEVRVSLRLTATPPADVYVDGQRAARKAALQVLPGLHYLRVLRPGYQTKALVVRVPAEGYRMQVQLDALPSEPTTLKRQLGQLISDGELDVRDPLQLAFVGRVAQVDRVLWWRPSGTDALSAALLSVKDSRELRRVTLPRERVAELWGLLTSATPKAAPDPLARPLWKRWWFWALGSAVVAGAASAVVIGLASRDPVLNVRVQ